MNGSIVFEFFTGWSLRRWSALRPGDELVTELSNFRFSHDQPDDEDQQADIASTPRDLILPALTDENGE